MKQVVACDRAIAINDRLGVGAIHSIDAIDVMLSLISKSPIAAAFSSNPGIVRMFIPAKSAITSGPGSAFAS